ncbi:MAG TPA: hypothetical protein VGA34_01465 [Alteraurantiacibacter sp.]
MAESPQSSETDEGSVRMQGKRRRRLRKVPGISTNPATNLLIADVVLRGLSRLVRGNIEKNMLRAQYEPEEAKRILKGRTLGQRAMQLTASRVAMRSIPGALLVTGGLLAKAMFDRSRSKREAERAGRKKLEEQAKNAES